MTDVRKESPGEDGGRGDIPTPRTDAIQDYDTITLCMKLRRLCRELERELPRWIPVTERLPESGARVYAYNGRISAVAKYYKFIDGEERWVDMEIDRDINYHAVTHWSPRQEPPPSAVRPK